MQTTSNDTGALRNLTAPLAGVTVLLVVAAASSHVALATTAVALDRVPLTPARALTGTLAGLAAVGALWLLLGVALAALSRLPGGLGRTADRAARALSPRLVRHVAVLVLGAGIGSGATGGAHAQPPATAVSAPQPDGAQSLAADPGWAAGGADIRAATVPDPGWVPEAPRVRPQPDVGVLTGRPAPVPSASAEVVVRRGDSLWAVAARHLGEGATDAQVAAEWPRWYARNRHVVGPDPDLLLPGQMLVAPDAPAGPGR